MKNLNKLAACAVALVALGCTEEEKTNGEPVLSAKPVQIVAPQLPREYSEALEQQMAERSAVFNGPNPVQRDARKLDEVLSRERQMMLDAMTRQKEQDARQYN